MILCGIETQACVQQTALDLMEDNYEVHVIADAVSSRSMVDRSDRAQGEGAIFSHFFFYQIFQSFIFQIFLIFFF